MKASEKYLVNNRSYDGERMLVECAGIYGEICRLEGKIEYIEEEIKKLENVDSTLAKIIEVGFRADLYLKKAELETLLTENGITI